MSGADLAAAKIGGRLSAAGINREKVEYVTPHHGLAGLGVSLLVVAAAVSAPAAHADSKTTQRRCSSERLHDSKPGRLHDESQPQSELQLAAQWHTDDVLNNRSLDGDLGSGGSTPQDRAKASGFRDTVADTVAINPALAISGIELINQWYYNPDYLAIMRDCANTVIGVWSESLLDRTVVVAVYGQPA